MSIIDRIRELFGGKQSGSDHGTTAGGAAAATSGDDPGRDVASQPGSDWSGGGDSGGGGDGGGGSGT